MRPLEEKLEVVTNILFYVELICGQAVGHVHCDSRQRFCLLCVLVDVVLL